MMPLLALVLVHRFFLRIPAAGPVARVTLLIGICIFKGFLTVLRSGRVWKGLEEIEGGGVQRFGGI
jgi:hypothetical protein